MLDNNFVRAPKNRKKRKKKKRKTKKIGTKKEKKKRSITKKGPNGLSLRVYLMQSYPPRALDRRLQEDWARDAREGPRILMSLRVDFGLMG